VLEQFFGAAVRQQALFIRDPEWSAKYVAGSLRKHQQMFCVLYVITHGGW
jgi:hypothetical protein